MRQRITITQNFNYYVGLTKHVIQEFFTTLFTFSYLKRSKYTNHFLQNPEKCIETENSSVWASNCETERR